MIAFSDNILADLFELAWNQNLLKVFASSLIIDV